MSIHAYHSGFLFREYQFIGVDFGSRSSIARRVNGPSAIFEAFGVSGPCDGINRPIGLKDRKVSFRPPCEAGVIPYGRRQIGFLIFDRENGYPRSITSDDLKEFGLFPDYPVSIGWSRDRFGIISRHPEDFPRLDRIADALDRGRAAFQFVADSNFDGEHLKLYLLDDLPKSQYDVWDREVRISRH